MDSQERDRREIKKGLWSTLPILILIFCIPFMSVFFSNFIPNGETPGGWFQRSGSIMVALAVWSEIKNNVLSPYFDLQGLVSTDAITLQKDYEIYFLLIRWVGLIFAILGTLVWGYGDIALNLMKNE